MPQKDYDADFLEKRIRERIDRLAEPHADCINADEYLPYCDTYEYCGETVKDYSIAVQKALNEHPGVEIPYHSEPLYFRHCIKINSGNTLRVHPETRMIFTRDGVMLRNRNVLDGRFREVSPGDSSDRDISVTGGIWEAPESVIINCRETFDGGSDGLFLFSNVIGCRFEHVTIRHSRRMGLMIGNCSDFLINNICFAEDQNRDGIHVEGPASWGVIRDIRGLTGDDIVALNAWNWKAGRLTFGGIHDIIVEKINCLPGHLWSEMRLLPGNYVFPDGSMTECPVFNTVFQDITGVHTFKLYYQPDWTPDGKNDRSFGPGLIHNLFFRRIRMDYYPANAYYTAKNACFEIHANGGEIHLSDIDVSYPLADPAYSDYRFVAVGPNSATWKYSDNPEDWVEFFDPDRDCHIDGVTMTNITVQGERCNDPDLLILIRKLTVNPDYPRKTPAGGTGRGTVRNIRII